MYAPLRVRRWAHTAKESKMTQNRAKNTKKKATQGETEQDKAIENKTKPGRATHKQTGARERLSTVLQIKLTLQELQIFGRAAAALNIVGACYCWNSRLNPHYSAHEKMS